MADDDTTETTPAAAADDTAADANASDSTAERKPGRFEGTMEVPRWMAGLVVALLLVGVGFAIGWFASPGDNDHGREISLRIPDGRVPGMNRLQIPNLPNAPGFPGAPQARRPILGVAIEDSDNPAGARVTDVAPRSPADDAGLQSGDVITAVGDTHVSNAADLIQAIESHAGDKVTLHFRRGSDDKTADVTLRDRNRDGGNGDGGNGDGGNQDGGTGSSS